MGGAPAEVARVRACNTPGSAQVPAEVLLAVIWAPGAQHVLDGAESGGLHHERMCGAAELMSNTRMHRASKQKHHLDNLVLTPLPWLHGVPCGPPKPLQRVYEGGL